MSLKKIRYSSLVLLGQFAVSGPRMEPELSARVISQRLFQKASVRKGDHLVG